MLDAKLYPHVTDGSYHRLNDLCARSYGAKINTTPSQSRDQTAFLSKIIMSSYRFSAVCTRLLKGVEIDGFGIDRFLILRGD